MSSWMGLGEGAYSLCEAGSSHGVDYVLKCWDSLRQLGEAEAQQCVADAQTATMAAGASRASLFPNAHHGARCHRLQRKPVLRPGRRHVDLIQIHVRLHPGQYG